MRTAAAQIGIALTSKFKTSQNGGIDVWVLTKWSD